MTRNKHLVRPRGVIAPQGLIGIACLAMVAACTPAGVEQWQPVTAAAQKTNRVELTRLAHTVRFAPNAAALTPGETTSLASFLDDSDIVYGDHVFLETPPGNHLSTARQAAIRRVLARRGVLMTTVPATRAPGGERPPAGDEMTVQLERYVVTPPNCPDWSKPPGGDPTNSVSSNFGCATEANLGMMVAEPRDLLAGRQPGPPDAEPALRAIRNYRAGRTVALPDDLSGKSAPSSSGAGPGASAGAGGGASGGTGAGSGSGG